VSKKTRPPLKNQNSSVLGHFEFKIEKNREKTFISKAKEAACYSKGISI